MSERIKVIKYGLANYPRMDKAGPPSIGGGSRDSGFG